MLGVSTQSEARIPGYMTPFSYPLQSINILSGTKDSVHVPTMKNMESLHYANKPAPTHKNDVAAPKTHPCYGEIYPSFYAGPHAISMSAAAASGYGFGRAHDSVNSPHMMFKATHGHLKHMDAHHPHEEVKHSKHHRHMRAEHNKEGMFLKKAMAEHKKEGKYM
jgi:hypothetical protein